MINNVFSQLEICKKDEIKLREGFTLPFSFHIKDIEDYEVEIINASDEYKTKFKYEALENNLKSVVKFLDLDMFEFDEDISDMGYKTKVNDGKYYIANKDCAYKFIKDFCSENDFKKLTAFVSSNRNKIATECLNRIYDLMGNGIKKADYTLLFSEVQAGVETNGNVFFEENIGKSYSCYSYRERTLRRTYISRKFELEKITRDEYDKKNKNKKK